MPSNLRDRHGRPALHVRVLAIVVALLLALPLTALVLRGLAALLSALI